MTTAKTHPYADIVSDAWGSSVLSNIAYGLALFATGLAMLTFNSTKPTWGYWLDLEGYAFFLGGPIMCAYVVVDRIVNLSRDTDEAGRLPASRFRDLLWIVGFRGVVATTNGIFLTGTGLFLLIAGTSLDVIPISDVDAG